MSWLEYFNQFGKKAPEPELVRDKEESFAPLELPDTTIVASGGVMSTIFSYGLNSSSTEADKITSWRSLAQCPEIAWAVQEICNDAVIMDYQDYQCELIFDDEEKELPKKIKERLIEEFFNILTLMNFKRNGIDYFRQWYIDGKAYYHGVLDPKAPSKGLINIRVIDPRSMQRIIEMEEKKSASGAKIKTVVDDYYLYTPRSHKTASQGFTYDLFNSTANEVLRINPEAIAYSNSGLFFEKGDGTSFSMSYLNQALRSYNMMSSLENAMTIYRLARAPERRVFYVDTGNLPPSAAEQHLSKVMARFKRKLSFNNASGEIISENGEFGIMDDYWLPRKEGGRGTEVQTLQSGQGWNDMNDLEWFQRKVLRSLNVPFGRYQSDNPFSMGRSMEITREEVKFAKFISHLRAKFSQGLIQLLKIQVISKNIMKIEEFESVMNSIYVKWKTDAYWDELLFNEMWQQRVNLANQLEPMIGKYVSHLWVQKNVLQFTDIDIDDERKQIEKERNDPFFKPLQIDEPGTE